MSQVKHNRTIALTGGLACGKSTVAKFLRAEGVEVVDADALARETLLPESEGFQKVLRLFGPKILLRDGHLDKRAIRQQIFQEDELKRKLEAIMHPLIAKAAAVRFAAATSAGAPFVVYEASLIFETGRAGDFAGVLLVTSPPETQLARALRRDPSLDEALARRILASQMPQQEQRKLAKWVIDNSNESPDGLRALEAATLNWLALVDAAMNSTAVTRYSR
jgi:dephospho-CoA kinase